MDFLTLPEARPLRLTDLTAPGCLVGSDAETVPIALTLDGERLSEAPPAAEVSMRGAMVFPAFTDMHTHLDKGQIWARRPNPTGRFMDALEAVELDRTTLWSAEDVRARAAFSLRCAYAHGTRAVRTHLDSIPPQDEISFPVFRELREAWRGRIDLQAVCLVVAENVDPDGGGRFLRTADIVAESGAVLGMVPQMLPDMKDRLRAFFRHADARGLPADFHVDETGDPAAATLRMIAEVVLETGFDAPVTVGHCCSLAVQPEAEALRTLDLVAKAGLNVVSLPMCNMYLQDRALGRTPRWRGVTLVHEMKARGIPVAFASDNTRDPFYAYGDMDMLEVMREATRIAHLDHGVGDWPAAFTTTPAAICGFAAPSLAPGAPADLVITRARSFNELFSRPQSDRIVIRAGRPIDRTLPDYAELDPLMRTA